MLFTKNRHKIVQAQQYHWPKEKINIKHGLKLLKDIKGMTEMWRPDKKSVAPVE